MSRTASNTTRTEIITQKLKSDNCRALSKIEWDNDGVWTEITDIDTKSGLSITKQAKRKKYANFSLLPIASTMSFKVLNKNGEYSEGSGQSEAGILVIDRKIRSTLSYLINLVLSEQTTSSDILDLSSAGNAFYFFTQNSSGSVILDSINSGGEIDTNFND